MLNSANDLVPFAMELLDNVADLGSGLKIVSDRVCKYYNFHDITMVRYAKGTLHKSFHWNNEAAMQRGEYIRTDENDWDYIDKHFDDQGVMILRKSVMEQMKGTVMGSILFVKVESGEDENGYVAFIDRENDRDWKEEKKVLVKLAQIFFSRIQKLVEEQKTRLEIDRKLNYDALTNLPNYSKFMEMASNYVATNENSNLYFVYSDFSNF